MPLDYSKWKSIEVSDDEDETHPNIDTPSLFRWRHQARLERMAEAKQAKEELEQKKLGAITKMQEIEEKLRSKNIEEKERIKLKLEKEAISKQEEQFKKKELEIEEKERLQPWNVDTIGHDKWNKTIVNKPSEKKDITAKEIEDDDEMGLKLIDFFEKYDTELKQFSMLNGFDNVEKFLLEHPHLCCENATSFLTIEALNYAIEEKYSLMDKVTENCITLQYLLELAKSLNAVSSNTLVIQNFFKKIRKADAMYLKLYGDEVVAFRQRLRDRAKEKRDAAIREAKQEEKSRRIAESPGGLDPQEVLDSLPKAMQEAFHSQDICMMRKAANEMDIGVFEYHLQRCIDSGLWVPNSGNRTGGESVEVKLGDEEPEHESHV